MSIKERVSEYCNYKNIAISKFESLSGISNGYFNNIKKRPSDEKIEKIHRAFPDLNTGWLMTGEGEMLKNIHQTANGDGNMQVAGNGNTVTHSDTALTKALDELAEQRKLVAKAQEQTSKAQEQIDRLIGLLEKK